MLGDSEVVVTLSNRRSLNIFDKRFSLLGSKLRPEDEWLFSLMCKQNSVSQLGSGVRYVQTLLVVQYYCLRQRD